jgi:dTDP-4-dehydrorhamnose reductase
VNVVLLGAAGLLGRSLAASPPPGTTLSAFDRATADITDFGAIERLLRREAPDWVLNATAYTDVDGAERDRDTAFQVNGSAVSELARRCAIFGCGLVHFSTDYVFAGDRDTCYSEDAPVAPVNSYGASKEAGEREVRNSGARHLIIRTQWLFGHGGRSFLSTVARRARERQAIRVVADEWGCCTYVEDLAAATWEILGRASGTLHVANRGKVSRFEVARRVYEAAGVPELVTAARSADVPMLARRPVSSMLCVDRVEGILGRPMPAWTDAVDRYVATVA